MTAPSTPTSTASASTVPSTTVPTTTVPSTTAEVPILGAGDAVVAFDVGGTDMKAALADGAGRLHGLVRVPTPASTDGSADAVLAEIERVAADLRVGYPGILPLAAGLLVPGLVDDEAGIGVFAENLGWHDAPFRERLEEALGIPVSFSHDVRGAGEAEYRLGAAAAYRDVVVLVIGTGIAGAIFIDGRLYVAGGYAGELGHSIVEPGGPLCACGGRGCLEAIASAGAIARTYERATGRTVDGAREVLRLAEQGDPLARGIWDRALDALALALSHTVALLAPEAIVIGGGLSQAGDALFEPLTARLDTLLTFHRRPALLPASIGQNAGLIGAALRARDLLASRAVRS